MADVSMLFGVQGKLFAQNLAKLLRAGNMDVYIKAEENVITLKAHSGTFLATVRIATSAESQVTITAGECVISNNAAKKIVATLNDDNFYWFGIIDNEPLRINCSGGKVLNLVTIRRGTMTYNTVLEDCTQEQINGGVIAIQQKKFKQILKQTIYASATEKSRPLYQKLIRVDTRNGLFLAATDAHRITSIDTANFGRIGDFGECNIPCAAFLFVQSLLSNKGGITITHDSEKGAVEFSLGDWTINAKTSAAEQLQRINGIILRSESRVEGVARVKELQQAISLCSLLADDYGMINLCFEDGAITVTAEKAEYGRFYKPVEATISGGAAKLKMNAKFLLEFLKSLDSKKVTIGVFNGGLVATQGELISVMCAMNGSVEIARSGIEESAAHVA